MILLFLIICWQAVIQYRFYFNVFSSSMPRGIYKRVNEEPKTGSIAATCLTVEMARYGLERGYLTKGKCTTGIQPVLKKIIAGYKDTVVIHNSIVTVNGRELTGFEILETDSKGRDVELFYEGEQHLKKDEYWLMSDHKRKSWDSRYWGPVSIVYTLEPVWTINE
jgi:conjugative transfer signal peptidase TraF